MKKCITTILILILSVFFIACGENQTQGSPSAEEAGKIIFTANGEDFVRRGFTDKDGWAISFNKLLVNITDPCAYNPATQQTVVLQGSFFMDLALGDQNALPLEMGTLTQVKPDNYKCLKFKIERAHKGEYKDFSIIMIGTAQKQDQLIEFVIKLDEELYFDCDEGFIGDEVKGLLLPGQSTSVEMTFHFDHIFGDMEASPDDHINTGSVGFDFFYAFAHGNTINVTQQELKNSPEYSTLIQALRTLGHLGEGHCNCIDQSSKDLTE
jgi:hypothetical protein